MLEAVQHVRIARACFCNRLTSYASVCICVLSFLFGSYVLAVDLQSSACTSRKVIIPCQVFSVQRLFCSQQHYCWKLKSIHHGAQCIVDNTRPHWPVIGYTCEACYVLRQEREGSGGGLGGGGLGGGYPRFPHELQQLQ